MLYAQTMASLLTNRYNKPKKLTDVPHHDDHALEVVCGVKGMQINLNMKSLHQFTYHTAVFPEQKPFENKPSAKHAASDCDLAEHSTSKPVRLIFKAQNLHSLA
jgi:hypothetical protein